MPKYNLHRANFYDFKPNAIHNLSYDTTSKRVAVSRADFSIEIWDLKNAPYQERVIPAVVGTSVEALAWCRGRLFSTGLSAFVTEYDLQAINAKQTAAVIGGPTWCLASNQEENCLAAGTEDGYICLFQVSSDDFSFERRFDKQEGRILCLSWHESGEVLVTGSVDSIRVWDVKSGHAVHRITVGRIKKNTETIVWCLAILKDHTIVSGDSCGRTSFWNGKNGTLLSSTKVHKADVLSLAVSKNSDIIYTSGIDPVIFQFAKVTTQSGSDSREIWVKSVQRVLHTHDVRAMTMAGQFLVSGGVDSDLVFSKYPPKTSLRFPAVRQGSCIYLSASSRCLLLQYSKSIEIWKLGTSSQNEGHDGTILSLSQNETRVLVLNCPEGETITCSAISEDTKWLAYSTNNQIRLFSFTMEDDPLTLVPNVNLQKIRFLPEDCQTAQVLAFTETGKYLLLTTAEGKLQVLETNLVQPCLVHTFNGPSSSKDRINLVVCSSDSERCAASDSLGNVTVYDLKKMQPLCILPHYKCQPTALAFRPNSGNLFVAYTNHKIVEYDCQKKCYTEWSKSLTKHNVAFNPHYPILGITFAGEKPERLVLHDDATVYFMEMGDKLTQSLLNTKRSKKEGNAEVASETEEVIKMTKKFKHLLGFKCLSATELVAVELLPESMLETLPAALRRKKFGT